MYARVTTGQFRPGEVDEAIRVWNEVLPPYKEVKGFRDAYLLIDRITSKTVMLSLWDSEEDSRAHVESGEMMQALSQFFGLLTELPDMEGYEVAATA
jgi:heme-degrading monooxygenase HmoA